MRGKAEESHQAFLLYGITPAYAGKSKHQHSDQRLSQDHPRLCGEKLETRHDFTEKLGSPPPMRGKVLHVHIKVLQNGITPAYAGKRYHSFQC